MWRTTHISNWAFHRYYSSQTNDAMVKQVVFALLFLCKYRVDTLPSSTWSLCSFSPVVAANATVTLQQIALANKALEAAIAESNQCDSSADCAAIPTGARGCGGPSSYAVYSTKTANVELIQKLAQVTVELEQQYNTEQSIVSICSTVEAPTTVCDQTNICISGSEVSPGTPSDS